MSTLLLSLDDLVQLTAKEDAATLAAIDRGILGADENKTVSIDEARDLISGWIQSSKHG